MSNQSQAWVNNIMTTTSLKIQNTTVLHSGCALKVEGDINATNGTELSVLYLKAKNYKQDSGATLHLQDQSMVDIEGKYVNLNNGQGRADLQDKDGVAVIKANAFYYNAPQKQGDWNPGGAKTVDCSIFSTPGDNAHIIVDANAIYGSEGLPLRLQMRIQLLYGTIMPISSSRMIQKPRTTSSRRLSAILTDTMQTRSLQRSLHST